VRRSPGALKSWCAECGRGRLRGRPSPWPRPHSVAAWRTGAEETPSGSLASREGSPRAASRPSSDPGLAQRRPAGCRQRARRAHGASRSGAAPLTSAAESPQRRRRTAPDRSRGRPCALAASGRRAERPGARARAQGAALLVPHGGGVLQVVAAAQAGPGREAPAVRAPGGAVRAGAPAAPALPPCSGGPPAHPVWCQGAAGRAVDAASVPELGAGPRAQPSRMCCVCVGRASDTGRAGLP
jgi:hypothetical protein